MQCANDEEIVAVIAHELGHWKLNHTLYSFIAVQVCCWSKVADMLSVFALLFYPVLFFRLGIL